MGKELNELEVLLEINSNLKKLLAISATQGKNEIDKIKIFYNLGYSSFEISELTGMPASSVRGIQNKKSKVKKK